MSDKKQQFGAYALYYDLLYREKDYQGEVDYVQRLLERYSPRARRLLNLGCGTGRHDSLFAKAGFEVTGVDLSLDMISVAKKRHGSRATYHQGDARTVRLNQEFDVVTALFHVMSYQIDNPDLKAVLETARQHLSPGGLFVFDCWYGPGVLTDPPTTRVKRMANDSVSVTRLAESTQDANRNQVTVNYEILIEELSSGRVQKLRESHLMRYLFTPEIYLLAELCGFTVEHFETWMTGDTPGLDTWNVVYILRRD